MLLFKGGAFMSLFKKYLLMAAALPAALCITGCGFTPMYGTHSAAVAGQTAGQTAGIQQSFSDIEINNIPDEEGQYLRNQLIDRLYANASPHGTARYALSVSRLKKRLLAMGVRKDASTTRGEVLITADVTILDRNTGARVLQRNLTARGDYNQLNNLYAARVSEDASTDRVLEQLADSIFTEVSLYFSRAAEGIPSLPPRARADSTATDLMNRTLNNEDDSFTSSSIVPESSVSESGGTEDSQAVDPSQSGGQ